MTTPVKLYVYDLSNGLARQLSMQLTGRQMDGIWHTSVVVFGKEIFYGQGINITAPGQSHHGRPLQIIDVGETALDEETLDEYLNEMRQHYTADKYHLLEFNCNSFTNDCVGFLTGGSIPSFIKDLPIDFLSTPFGAALRPTIDAMYRRPVAEAASIASTRTTADVSSNPQLAASILQSIATQAQSGGVLPSVARGGLQATETLTAPVHVITNPSSFHSFIQTHRAAVAFFTSATCPPCRMIEPVFERFAEEKGTHDGKNGAAFAKIDIDVGMGGALSSEWGIRATPTFIFFIDGKKLGEMKGANVQELRTQVDLLIFQVYPPHPHTSLSIPTIQKLSTNPILFTQVPAIDMVVTKLSSSIDATSWPTSAPQTQDQIKQALTGTIALYLKARFASATTNGTTVKALPSATPNILSSWMLVTSTLVGTVSVDALFPLVDIWRLAYLDPAVHKFFTEHTTDPISLFVEKANHAVQVSSKASRNFILITLRLLANAFSGEGLAKRILTGAARTKFTSVLIPCLLHEDVAVRTAASSLAFNAAAVLQKDRIEAVKTGRGIQSENELVEEDWEIEMVSALVEALSREKDNEEVVHRLTAALAFLVRLSPFYDTQLKTLLEVLRSREILRGKLVKGDGWCGENGINKAHIRKLVEEVANKLCP
ncbi:thioredoxin family protein [Cyathus striatus]|nr:thioredoxin family protein [Cyathus striatus]